MDYRCARGHIHYVVDEKYNKTYKFGHFLGKGAFGICYKVTEEKTGKVYACKMISKKFLSDEYLQRKLQDEITILSYIKHKYIVGYHSNFEYNNSVNIILELCRKTTMCDLLKRRMTLTEPEVRYFLRQITLGVQHLHLNNIIHRDLKLSNLFLDSYLQVKIGDFGTSVIKKHAQQMQMTFIGKAVFAAPEIILGRGHDCEVDVWAIGCIMYTLLVGRNPFEAVTREGMYDRISSGMYEPPNPHVVSASASELIRRTLNPEPRTRLKINDVIASKFLNTGYTPRELPLSCLTLRPRFELPGHNNLVVSIKLSATSVVITVPAKQPATACSYKASLTAMNRLCDQISVMLASEPGRRTPADFGVEYTYPAADPVVWITKTCSRSAQTEYCCAYQLSDKTIGVLFRDDTKLLLMGDQYFVHYISSKGEEYYYTYTAIPVSLIPKMTVLKSVRRQLLSHSGIRQVDFSVTTERSVLSRVPHVFRCVFTPTANVMLLSNGTVQMHFLVNHIQVLFCSCMGSVTFLADQAADMHSTYLLKDIQDTGCSEKMVIFLVDIFSLLRQVLGK